MTPRVRSPRGPDGRAARDLDAPLEALRAFRMARCGARKRGEAWRLPFRLWWSVWAGRWHERGSGRDQVCMARRLLYLGWDEGNVVLLTNAESVARIGAEGFSERARAGWRTSRARDGELARRGDDNPASKAVMTPCGRFGSIALAAEHFGVTAPTASRRARLGLRGWSFDGLNTEGKGCGHGLQVRSRDRAEAARSAERAEAGAGFG